MSKYENSVFPYSVHCTVNLLAWRPKDTNVTLISFLRLFTPVYSHSHDNYSRKKSFFSKLHDKCCKN